MKQDLNSLKLISINESEVLCYSPQTCKLIIFNHGLEQVLCLGQTTSESDGFFFKNGTLVDANRHFIVFYKTNPIVQHNNNFQEHSIKILSRKTGMSVGEISIESEYFSLLLKLDLHDNIFYKPQHPLDVLQCYQAPSGNLINEFVNPRFIGMSSIAVTKNNQMVCVNRRDNLMYIIQNTALLFLYFIIYNFFPAYYVGSSHLPNKRCERSHNAHRSLTVM